MRTILVAAILVFSGLAQTPPSPVKNEPEHSKKQAGPLNDTPSTASEPTSPVAPLVAQPTPNPRASETKEKVNSWPAWSDIFWPTWVLVIVTAIAVGAALKTLKAINAQVTEMRATGVQTDKLIAENIAQSTSMQKSVAEATRLASAMEVVSKGITISSKTAIDSVAALRERTAQQMRAYLTIMVGSASFQERDKNIRFEARPLLINCGHTPAHEVAYKAKAAILPVPLPADFDFPLPQDFIGSSIVGPQQTNILAAMIDDFLPDAEVAEIKTGQHRALYVWGLVTYKDIFDIEQTTRFCQLIYWLTDTNIFGVYISRHNQAT